LLLKRNVGRQRSHMPMDVPVTLLTSEAEEVQALRWNNLANCLTDAVNYRCFPRSTRR